MTKKYRDARSELLELHESVVDTDALNLPRRYHMLGIAIDNYQDSKFDILHQAIDEVQSLGVTFAIKFKHKQGARLNPIISRN